MLNINGYLIDHTQIVMVRPCGKIIMRDHGEMNVGEEVAKILVAEIGTTPRIEPPIDSGCKEREVVLPSSPPFRSCSSSQASASLNQELLALCNRLASLLVVGRSCGVCGSEIIQENVKVMAHPLAGANVDRGVEVEIEWEHR